MAYTVIRGYKEAGKSEGEVCIYTLDGEKLFVNHDDIEKEFENEAPKKGSGTLTTFFLKVNALVRIEVQLNENATSQGQTPSTIYKYLDDGGTISKSRDDLLSQSPTIAKYIDDGGTPRKSLDDGPYGW